MTKRALCGVNIGGWLIAEPWMTPGLFAGTTARDEYTLAATPGGREKLTQHRHTFIKEEDFAWMAAHGVELVRIPFGYWLFTDDGEYEGDVERLDWAVKMAEMYGLKVLLDLHALPGSQNGKNHSGRIGESAWYADKSHREQSRDVCLQVAKRYVNSPALWGLEIINEPAVNLRRYFILLAYYRRVQRDLSGVMPPSVYLVFSDAFMPWLLAGALRGNNRQRVAMDTHWYSWMISAKPGTTLEKFFARVVRRKYTLRWIQRLAHPIVVGEWGAVLPHSLKPYVGARSWREAATEHFTLQKEVYSSALAECYWTYKTEQPGMWSYRTIVKNALSEASDGATLDV